VICNEDQLVCGFAIGHPKPQPRPRATNRGGFIRIYTPSSAEAWKTAVRDSVLEMSTVDGLRIGPRGPLGGPLSLELTFLLKRPGRLMRKKDTDGVVSHVASPDIDNLTKAVMDALTDSGRVWFDDCQVQDLHVYKRYAPKHGATGCKIRIFRSEDQLTLVI